MLTVKFSSKNMGEVVYISQYLERKHEAVDPLEIRKRLADIAIEQMLLSSERIRLQKVLDER